MNDRFNDIKENWHNTNLPIDDNDIDWLIEEVELLKKRNSRYEEALRRIASDNVIWEQTQVIALRALGEQPFDIYSALGVPRKLFENPNSNASEANTYPIIEKENQNEKNE